MYFDVMRMNLRFISIANKYCMSFNQYLKSWGSNTITINSHVMLFWVCGTACAYETTSSLWLLCTSCSAEIIQIILLVYLLPGVLLRCVPLHTQVMNAVMINYPNVIQKYLIRVASKNKIPPNNLVTVVDSITCGNLFHEFPTQFLKVFLNKTVFVLSLISSNYNLSLLHAYLLHFFSEKNIDKHLFDQSYSINVSIMSLLLLTATVVIRQIPYWGNQFCSLNLLYSMRSLKWKLTFATK